GRCGQFLPRGAGGLATAGTFRGQAGARRRTGRWSSHRPRAAGGPGTGGRRREPRGRLRARRTFEGDGRRDQGRMNSRVPAVGPALTTPVRRRGRKVPISSQV